MTRWTLAPLLVLAALGGCLPSSQKHNSRSLIEADSVSARRAAEAPVDTLGVVWTARAPEADPMAVPMTLGWVAGRLAVVDALDGSVRSFTDEGAYGGRTDGGGEGAFPYLAGARGDTVVVLARGRSELLWVRPGEGVVRTVAVPEGALMGVVGDSVLAVRLGGGVSEAAPEVVTVTENGTVAGRHPLRGPAWRSAGSLRVWDGRVVALSGYRPVVDVLPAGARPSAPLDTLALDGFDSPQFVRSAQFLRGEVNEPPLLMSSADPLGTRLFVLNLRDDHVRIDVYGRDGALRQVLVSPRPWAPIDAVPQDLAVRPGPDGTIDLAVLMARPPGLLRSPESRVVLYRWRPASPLAL